MGINNINNILKFIKYEDTSSGLYIEYVAANYAIDFMTHLHMASNKHYVCMPVPQFSLHHCGSLQ